MESPDLKPVHNEISKTKAALQAKCPRCRQGNLFANSMYGLKPQKMNVYCSYCGLRFEREPGYFYVAMFVSYALTTAQMIAIGVLTYLVTGEDNSPWIYLITIFTGIILLSPFNFRYSRVILLYWLTPNLDYAPGRRDESRKEQKH
jgi:uncharacterized protein (DUF983 family)